MAPFSVHATYGLKRASRDSFVVSSGKFCTNKILFGGRYSSGICTIRRACDAAAGVGSVSPEAAAASAAVYARRQEARCMRKIQRERVNEQDCCAIPSELA